MQEQRGVPEQHVGPAPGSGGLIQPDRRAEQQVDRESGAGKEQGIGDRRREEVGDGHPQRE